MYASTPISAPLAAPDWRNRTLALPTAAGPAAAASRSMVSSRSTFSTGRQTSAATREPPATPNHSQRGALRGPAPKGIRNAAVTEPESLAEPMPANPARRRSHGCGRQPRPTRPSTSRLPGRLVSHSATDASSDTVVVRLSRAPNRVPPRGRST